MVIVLAIGVVLYARTLRYSFHLDDYVLIRPWSLDQLRQTLTGTFEMSGFSGDSYFRPLASLTFALEWPLYGTSRLGYHLTNLALHLAAGVGVLLLLRRVRLPRWAPLVGALVFVAVPLNSWTVLYIAERTDAMVAICAIAVLLLLHRYDRTGRTSCLVGINILFVAALCMKEQATSIPMMVIVFWWYLRFERNDPTPGGSVFTYWGREARLALSTLVARPLRREWLRIVGPMVGILVAYLVYRTIILTTTEAWTGRFGDTKSPPAALLAGINSTFRMTPWEVRSLVYYPAIVAVVGAALLLPRSRSWRVVLLGLGLIIAGVLPLTFSGAILPRTLYVAEIGMVTAIAGVAAVYVEAIAMRRGGARVLLASLTGALAAVLVATTLTATLRSQELFRDGTNLILDGQQAVYETRATFDDVPPELMQEIEERLAAAGRPLRPGIR